jgi:3-dehydroquinate synthetase
MLLIVNVAIHRALDAEIPNHAQANLDRFMFFGHTWSPLLELATSPILLHGHAVSVDMCYSFAVAEKLGYIAKSVRVQFLQLLEKLGLTLDDPSFTWDLVKEGTTKAIANRDGRLRLPLPKENLGSYVIEQDVQESILEDAYQLHKTDAKIYARGGQGVEAHISVRLHA